MIGRTATAIWLVLGVCSALGCIPIFTPRVQQDITTGDKLAALRSAEADHSHEELAKLRADLLAHPPDMRAAIENGSRTDADPPTQGVSYAFFNPGFYAPVSTERADLRRARDAGLLSADEYATLDAELERQAERSMVRRWFETESMAIAGSIRRGYLSRDRSVDRTPATVRNWASGFWVDDALRTGDAHSNAGQQGWDAVALRYKRVFVMDPARAEARPTPKSAD